MVLIRMLVAEGIFRNVWIFARHVRTKMNDKANALSRLDLKRFWRLAGGTMNNQPSTLPSTLPLRWKVLFKNLWLNNIGHQQQEIT